MNRSDYRYLMTDRDRRRTQEILDEIRDYGSPSVCAEELSHLLAYFEQRIEALENLAALVNQTFKRFDPQDVFQTIFVDQTEDD